MSDTTATRERAGFWRRAFAIIIDVCLVNLVLGVVALFLFAPTGGWIRIANIPIDGRSCAQRDVQSFQGLDLGLPADFKVTHVVACTRSIMGFVHDRILVAAEVTQSGIATYTRSFQYPVDADDRPMSAFYLDNLSLVLCFTYLLLLQWRSGRTLGMDLTNIRVRSLTGAPLSLSQVAKRLLFLSIPVLIVSTMLLGPIFGATILTAPTLYWSIGIVALVAGAMIAINFIDMVRRQALPWHDRLAGTEVVLGRSLRTRNS